MRRPPRLAVALVALVAASAWIAPADAHASEVSMILNRCARGQSLAGFKQSAYRKALKDLPEAGRQYSECEELIRKAQLEAAGHFGTGGPGGGSATPLPVTPVEQHAIDAATHKTPGRLAIGNKLVVPGVTHADIASVFSTLPTPLLALLIFLIVCTLAASGRALRDRVLTRRGI